MKLKKISVIILLLGTILKGSISNAQFTNNGQPSIDITNIIPKSPQAAQLVRVNELNVNMSRGVPAISFPLYTATVGALKIPISISYDASGIKVDDVPSATGLKWILNAGGEISRSINGRPDEVNYFSHASTYTSNYFGSLNYSNISVQDLMKDIAINNTDISQDQYSYNYLNKSGYFYYKDGGFKDCKDPNTVRISTTDVNFLGSSYTITDDNGNKAIFNNAAIEHSTSTYGGDGYDSPNVPPDGITAWKLNTLQTYLGEQATFDYSIYSYSTYKTASQAYTKRHSLVQGVDYYNCNCSDNTDKLNYSTVLNNFTTYNLTGIHTPNEDVLFYYSTNSLNIYNRQLDSIVVKDKISQANIKRIHFHYSSYSAVNLLRLSDIWDISTSSTDSVLIAGMHYNSDMLPGSATFSRDMFNYYNGAWNNYLISTNDADYNTHYSSADRSVNNQYINQGNLDTIYYPTGGKACFYFSANISGNYIGPGVKTDSIVYLDQNNNVAERYQYTYANPNNGYYQLSNYINNITYAADNSGTVCTVKNIHSEIDLGAPVSPFYYGEAEIRKLGKLSSSNSQLTKEIYTSFVDGYGIWRPELVKRIYFRNNSLLDTVKIESNIYSLVSNESTAIDWLRPGTYYTPPERYFLIDYNGNAVDVNNGTSCNVLYTSPGSYGSIAPRSSLLVGQEIKEFDQNNNQSSLRNVISSTYNDNWQKVSDTKTDSKGNTDAAYYTYLYTNAGNITSNILAGNLYAAVNKSVQYLNGVQMNQTRVNFNVQSNGYVLPDSFLIKKSGNAEFADKIITGYDIKGDITEINSRNNYTALLRDYNNQLIVAKADNARVSDIAYTSFESGSGNWSYNSNAVILDATSPTGNNCYSINGNTISAGNLNSGKTYIVSYWAKNGASCNVNASSPVRTGTTLDAWTYYEHEVSGTASVAVSGNGYIDELRLYPKGSMMTTYTHIPLVGISSQCDVSNHITYYQYDGLGRLKCIRDQNSNILKQFDYKYQTVQTSGATGFSLLAIDNNTTYSGYTATFTLVNSPYSTYSFTVNSGSNSLPVPPGLYNIQITPPPAGASYGLMAILSISGSNSLYSSGLVSSFSNVNIGPNNYNTINIY